ncbi:MAG: biotin/lipoyl-binding protein [Prevotellaceae bacterium]|jgi:biotin carboxyl carrier protein|nr:biotin/lipoyl-binding protein [Prevotellaceae bacterium]
MKEFKMTINGNEYSVVVNDVEENIAEVEVNGMAFKVTLDKPMRKTVPTIHTAPARPAVSAASSAGSAVAKPAAPIAPVAKPVAESGGGAVKSPLPGVILEVKVKVGDEVKVGQKLVVLEAMKMENNINSDKDGKVIEIKVQQGDSVLEGADLLVIG